MKVLAGTSIHAPRKYRKDMGDVEPRRRTISGDTLVSALTSGNSSTETVEKDANRLVRDGIEALDIQWSVKGLPKSRSQIGLSGSPKKSAKQRDLERRRSTRSAGEAFESLTKKISVLGKRGRKTVEDGLAELNIAKSRELRRLADTAEFAKIDTKPVLHEVWSNGKLVVEEPPRKKKKLEEAAAAKLKPEDEKPVEVKKVNGKREKVWLTKGLYAGQERNLDWFQDSSSNEKAAGEQTAPFNPKAFMPLPMWHGQRLLHVGRHFKLPFDVCSPLPPGQPKPDEWRKTSSSKCLRYTRIKTVTDCTLKIVSLVMLPHYGRSRVYLTASHLNVFAHPNSAVTRTVKTESCSMSVMTQTAELDVINATTEPLLTFKNVARLAESTGSALKLSRPRIVAMVFVLTDALMLIKSLLNTRVRLSLRMSVTDA